MLNLAADTRDHHVVGERWNRAIGQPLVTAIVSLGRFGEHLDDQLWVHECYEAHPMMEFEAA